MHRDWAHSVVRRIVGLILLTAAALKVHQLATQPTLDTSLLDSRAVLTAWVLAEIGLGLWLWSGLLPRAGHGAAVGCFTLFSAVTFWKAVHGEASCGCFGVVEVNPWYTLILDLAVVVSLIVFRPAWRPAAVPLRWRLRLATTLLLTLTAGFVSAFASASYRPAALSEEGQIIGDAAFVVLEPETWIGKPFPLARYVEGAGDIGKGRWTVVLYRHDCPHCQEKVPELQRQAREAGLLNGIPSVAMIELPPYAPPDKALVAPDSGCLAGRVSNVRNWFVETPVVLTLADGRVTTIQVGEGQVVAAWPGPAPPVSSLEHEVAAVPQTVTDEVVEATGNEYHFGYVEPKSLHKVRLAVANPSDAAMSIRRVRSECACMTASAPEQAVAADQPVVVRVTLDAPEKPIAYDQRVILQTDNPKCPTIAVRIKADVGLPLAAEPPSLDMGALAGSEKHEGQVTICNRGKSPARLLYSTSDNPGTFARLPRDPVPAQGSVVIPIVVAANARPQSKRITIHTDIDAQPTLDVVVRSTAEVDR
jgi:hypothetical protein